MKKLVAILSILLFTVSISNAQWVAINNFPGGATDGAVAFTIGNYAYVGGGLGSKKFYKFDPDNNSWTQLADIPGGFNRGWAFSFVINGIGYVCGGDKTGNFNLTNDVRAYDPVSDTWSKKADLPLAMDGAFACSVNGKAYVIGGFNGSQVLSSVYEYDPAADNWTAKANYPGGAVIFPSGFVINNKIYVGTGSPNGMSGSKLFYEYNPATNTWVQKADFPGSARQACISFSVGNMGFMGGGEVNYSVAFYDFYKYNPSANSWSKAINLYMQAGTAAAWCSSFVIGTTPYYGLGAYFVNSGLSYSNKFYKIAITGGVNENTMKKNISLSPNPAAKTIYVDLPKDIKPVGFSIFNIIGERCKTLSPQNNIIDISGLQNGLYFLEIKLPNDVIKIKFIISK